MKKQSSKSPIFKYFEPFPDDASPSEFRLVAIRDLIPSKQDEPVGEDGIAPSVKKALGHIRDIDAGLPGAMRRKPLDVADNRDGTYTIIDGNACHAAHSMLGTPELPVRILKDYE